MLEREKELSGFSRPTAIAAVGATDLPFAFEANADERQALALRFGVTCVDRLFAQGRLCRESKNRIRLQGRFEAEIGQISVLSLTEIPSILSESFNVLLCPEGDPLLDETDGEDRVVDLLSDDEIDQLVGEEIDLADQVAQFVCLAIDPYPREQNVKNITDLPDLEALPIKLKRVVTFDHPSGSVDEEDEEKPFMALKKLRQ